MPHTKSYPPDITPTQGCFYTHIYTHTTLDTLMLISHSIKTIVFLCFYGGVRLRFGLSMKLNPKPIDSITLAVEISPKAMRT